MKSVGLIGSNFTLKDRKVLCRFRVADGVFLQEEVH